MEIFNLILSLFIFIAAMLPISKSGAWWIRGFDFPRFQLFSLSVFTLLLQSYFFKDSFLHIVAVSAVLIAIGVDAYRIWPYTIFAKKQTKDTVQGELNQSLRLLSANVLQENRHFDELANQVEKHDPDLIVLVETDHWWLEQCREFKDRYPYTVECPQDNTYGILVFSKYVMRDARVEFLVDKKVPSVFTKVIIDEQHEFDLICLHPRPPRPKEGPSDQRDGELMKVARVVGDRGKGSSVIVIGDFNDVAWSHTTRLFKRVSGCLDPRVGRGPYATFPVAFPFLRVPLDHVFHSSNFTLDFMRRLKSIESDHFPLLMQLRFNSIADKKTQKPVEGSDNEDVDKLIERGDDWDGPENTLDSTES